MSYQKLNTLLYDLTSSARSYRWLDSATRYSDFILAYPKVHTSKLIKPFQKKLETFRPTIDYIILPDNHILIGFTEDYTKLKKAALAYIMELTLEASKRHLKAEQILVNYLKGYKTMEPFYTAYPELFI